MPPTSNFAGRDIVSVRDLSRSEIDQILDISQVMEPLAKTGSDMLHGKIMATLFYEPSTRTRLSFESAMTRLGGTALGFAETKGTSVEKGENLADTVRVVENYADVLVVRHPLEGAARMAAEFSRVPVINAGSGAEEHPTQALLERWFGSRGTSHPGIARSLHDQEGTRGHRRHHDWTHRGPSIRSDSSLSRVCAREIQSAIGPHLSRDTKDEERGVRGSFEKDRR